MNVTTSDLTPENLLERVTKVHDAVAESDKATRERLNSIAPSNDRLPLSPEQVDSFRPKNTVSTVDEAKAIAYKTGIKDLEPVIRRLIFLEAKVDEQETKITALQTTVLALKYPKV